jgi:hypothetical protein
MEHVLTSLVKCLDFMVQQNLKQHATVLEREEFMHSMLVDMVMVVLGEDTVAEVVILVRWRLLRSWWKPKSKSFPTVNGVNISDPNCSFSPKEWN